MKIDLDQVDDDLGGDWWHYISSENFGFVVNIPDINAHEVGKDDILIHKEKQTGERFTTIRYHIITDKGSDEVKKKDVNEVLAKKLVAYIQKHKEYPYACEFLKFFNNGSAQVNYSPTNFEKFPLKIIPKQHGLTHVELVGLLKNLKTAGNPITLQVGGGSQLESFLGKRVTVYNGEITKLDLKSYEYNENIVEYYLATLKASKISPQIKRKSDYRDEDVKVMSRAVVRISDNTCENLHLKVGDKISLNGGVVDDKFLGAMIKRSTKVLKLL